MDLPVTAPEGGFERRPDIPDDAPLHFVMNGRAGNHDDEGVLQALNEVIGGAARRFELHRPEKPDGLLDAARSAVHAAGKDGIVVAVGGDGTINSVARAVLEGDGVLGLVPRGTFNYVARNHRVPLEPAAAMALLLQGTVAGVQVGWLNDRPFLVNASLGMYPDLLEDRESFKERFGRNRLVAMGAALRSLLRRQNRLRLYVEADGQEGRYVKASTVFVGNNALQIAALGLPEAEALECSALAALVLRSFRPGEQLWIALRGAFGRLADSENTLHFAFREMSVSPRSPTSVRRYKVAIDGEVFRLAPPLQFKVGAKPLWLVHPPPPTVENV